ncbi:MAG: serine/threonine protein kinase, CMGC, CDC2/CDK sub [Thelocarpon impressellum]|nr:MAG: serine/threonine protein kinase, CMGC, CDC2/CDK sub [Thelocarpon impressellum]
MASQSRSPQAATGSRALLDTDQRGTPRFHGCSSIKEYEILGKLGEGTFGEVHKARSRGRGTTVALKKILMHNERDGFPITALREIKLLKMLSHVNILKLEEMAVERTKGEGRKKAIMYMVTPYMDHDLSGLLENPSVQFTEPQIKCYMLQLLEGLRYLHASHILHRDMKAANLLINNKGILQIADFGLARHYDEPVPQPGKGNGEARRDYTTLVVTRWYRPPELLLQLRKYTPAIDMWGVGCVFAEMFVRRPILAGNSDLNQAQIIFDLVGSPTEQNMPGWGSLPGCEGVRQFKSRPSTLSQRFREFSPQATVTPLRTDDKLRQGSSFISLLGDFLKLDWRKRINAIDALKHPYFRNEPLPANPEDLPHFEESHELDRRKFRGQKAALPPAPAGGTVGMGANGEWSGGGGGRGGQPYGNGAGVRNQRGGEWTGGHGSNGHDDTARGGHDNRGRDHGLPPRHQDHRGPRGPPGPPPRQPAWAGDRQDLRLPPRPPTTGWAGDGPGDGGRDRGPPRGGPGAGRGDTYIPSYSGSGDGQRRDERNDRSRDRRDWAGRQEDTRRRSRSPGRDRERMREQRDRDLYRR